MAESSSLIVLCSLILGVIGIVLAWDLVGRVLGKLKRFVIFFMSSIAIFTAGEIIRLFSIFEVVELTYLENLIEIGVAFFLFISVLSIKDVIEHIHKISEIEKKTRRRYSKKVNDGAEKVREEKKEFYLDLTKTAPE